MIYGNLFAFYGLAQGKLLHYFAFAILRYFMWILIIPEKKLSL
jgi:hypothetical protein